MMTSTKCTKASAVTNAPGQLQVQHWLFGMSLCCVGNSILVITYGLSGLNLLRELYVRKKHGHLTIYIIRVTLNTEFDTLWLSQVNCLDTSSNLRDSTLA